MKYFFQILVLIVIVSISIYSCRSKKSIVTEQPTVKVETEKEKENAPEKVVYDDKLFSVSPAPADIYSNVNLITGNSVLFYDDISEEVLDAKPEKWNTTGYCRVKNINETDQKWLCMYGSSTATTSLKIPSSKYNVMEADIAYDVKNKSALEVIEISLNGGSFINIEMKVNKNQIKVNKADAVGYQDFDVNKKLVHLSIIMTDVGTTVWIDNIPVAKLANVKAEAINNVKINVVNTSVDNRVAISNLRITTEEPRISQQFANTGKFFLRGIQFDLKEESPTNYSYSTLAEVAKAMKANPKVSYTVVVHNDGRLEKESNLKLSQTRANNVVNILVGMGVTKSRLKAVGKGETELLVNNSTLVYQATNRRVQFIRN